MRGEEPGIGNLVHSDLDADRLDYLPRTAIHAGLPYGRIDLDYLVSQISIDRDDRLCFSPKALNAVDHCLLGRYFDRMTIAFHKTVVGFELLLEQVLQDLFELNSVLKLTKADVRRMLQKGEWAAFDDDSIVAMIRKHLTTSAKPAVKARALAVLHREPLKLLAQLEYLGDRNDKDPFDVQVQIVERNIESWRKESASPFWTYWVKDGFTLTSLASSTPVSVARSITEQELEQSARIRRRNSQLSDPVTEVKQSLMSALGEKGYYALRVYALVGRPMINQAKVRQMLKRDLPGNRWVVTV